MSAANVAVALAGLSLAVSTAALVSVGALEKRMRARAPRAPLVPRLDLDSVRGEEAADEEQEEDGDGDGGWESGEWSDDDKENRPPASDDWKRTAGG